MGNNRALRWDENKGRWVNDYLRHERGRLGETNIGFWLGDKGYVIVDGPGGAAGHKVTAQGFDGVAFNPSTKEMIIYDNKSFATPRNIGGASAIEIQENLQKNLDKTIERIERRISEGNHYPHDKKILKNLRDARSSLKRGSGKPWPKKVQLHVYNASGKNAEGITKALEKQGLKFVDYYAAERIRRPLQFNPALKAMEQRFRKTAQAMERKAGVELSEKALENIERKVVMLAERKGVAFARKRLPKLIANAVLKQSAKQAAKRAASLLPVIGWGFAAQDIYKSGQDIFRGNVGRGLAGMGLSIADVASDFLHLGDAVSGVGGTAISLGVQAATISGQIAITIERFKEKMNELGEEIARLDSLPSDTRLRDYYELDEEDIEELKNEYAKKPDEPIDQEIDLPPPPMDLPPEFVPHYQYCSFFGQELEMNPAYPAPNKSVAPQKPPAPGKPAVPPPNRTVPKGFPCV